MNRMQEIELSKVSADYGAGYIKDRMKGGSIVENNLTLNCAAHGFYMGARFVEARQSGWFQRGPMAEQKAVAEGAKAATFYIKTRLQGLSPDQDAIARVAVSKGFVQGLRYREEHLTS